MLHDMNYIFINENNRIKCVLKKVILLLFLFLLFSFWYRVNITEVYSAKVIYDCDEYNMEVYISKNSLSFLELDELIIDDSKYSYKVVDMDYLKDSNDYLVVRILIDMSSYCNDKNYISVKQNMSNKSLFCFMLEKIKKGMF